MPVSVPPALTDLLGSLRCPSCLASLRLDSGALRCPVGHTFNIARQGYVSLLTGVRPTSGDDAAMARARSRFLASGKYSPVSQTLARIAAAALPEKGTVVDVGCGTGYYLSTVLDHAHTARGLGFDTSVRALRSAARAHVRGAAATWDVFRPVPLTDQAADAVLSVFAPRNPPEFHRILRRSGRLIVLRPTRRHVVELRRNVPGMIGIDPHKERRLHQSLDPLFKVIDTQKIEYTTSLTSGEAMDLVGMTPSARHVLDESLAHRGNLAEQVTVSVLATAYRPR